MASPRLTLFTSLHLAAIAVVLLLVLPKADQLPLERSISVDWAPRGDHPSDPGAARLGGPASGVGTTHA
ncbi:hypothetical protein [Cyanobium sp. Morenito 9A2]|uniref:hypothetical protein n=1 Tax=Cyanobium sp. Morenito 9A2 TaxID=2823718 RepID=UPI0020CF3FB8|nr:hypothetical protein [Cyanobium sp. Morenito 9A2]MCP9848728.1 hypothetical protein [Cyanobium sp. Morenito 9A2]